MFILSPRWLRGSGYPAVVRGERWGLQPGHGIRHASPGDFRQVEAGTAHGLPELLPGKWRTAVHFSSGVIRIQLSVVSHIVNHVLSDHIYVTYIYTYGQRHPKRDIRTFQIVFTQISPYTILKTIQRHPIVYTARKMCTLAVTNSISADPDQTRRRRRGGWTWSTLFAYVAWRWSYVTSSAKPGLWRDK